MKCKPCVEMGPSRNKKGCDADGQKGREEGVSGQRFHLWWEHQ